MPEAPNEVAASQRRANWVGLRTLRQLPKAVGHTDDGEPIYEIRSVRLLLHGTSSHFIRLTRCSRCMRDLAGAPVLSAADLDRLSRPLICGDCVRSARVSAVWEYEDAAVAAEPLSPAALAPPAGEAAPQPVAAEASPPAKRNVLEGHLRAVTERVNELGRIARAQQADAKERAEREEATASALREELAALRAFTEDSRVEMHRLAAAHADLERRRAQRPPAEEAGTGELAEEVARLGRLLEDQRAELAASITSLVETQEAHGQLARACQVLEDRVAEAVAHTADRAGQVDLATVEGLITNRLAEVKGTPAPAVDLSSIEALVASRVADAERRLTETLAPAVDHVDLSSIEELVGSRVAEAERRLAETLAPAVDHVDLSSVEELVASRVAEAERRLAPAPDHLDLATVEALVANRLHEAEGRLAREIVGQWGDLETTIEASVAASMGGFLRAQEKLAGGQGALEERVEELAGQLARASGRLESLLDRLDSVEEELRRAALERTVAFPAAAPPAQVPAGSLLDSLDRQLEAAARRLAARSQAGAGRGEP